LEVEIECLKVEEDRQSERDGG